MLHELDRLRYWSDALVWMTAVLVLAGVYLTLTRYYVDWWWPSRCRITSQVLLLIWAFVITVSAALLVVRATFGDRASALAAKLAGAIPHQQADWIHRALVKYPPGDVEILTPVRESQATDGIETLGQRLGMIFRDHGWRVTFGQTPDLEGTSITCQVYGPPELATERFVHPIADPVLQLRGGGTGGFNPDVGRERLFIQVTLPGGLG